ncbi:hypothetical protein [Chitinilyticum aquatile]|uniref:hypothetical protein n=1 Tax=Chitinilyticum aquatile TaxID=362520 RepID=UPI000420F9E8|nr:hypothetical protein [Chitinilyticum aquatile]
MGYLSQGRLQSRKAMSQLITASGVWNAPATLIRGSAVVTLCGGGTAYSPLGVRIKRRMDLLPGQAYPAAIGAVNGNTVFNGISAGSDTVGDLTFEGYGKQNVGGALLIEWDEFL